MTHFDFPGAFFAYQGCATKLLEQPLEYPFGSPPHLAVGL